MSNPPGCNTPPFAALKQNPAGIFFLNWHSLILLFIRLTRRGPDPNRPTYGSKEGRYDLRGFVRGEIVVHRNDERQCAGSVYKRTVRVAHVELYY